MQPPDDEAQAVQDVDLWLNAVCFFCPTIAVWFMLQVPLPPRICGGLLTAAFIATVITAILGKNLRIRRAALWALINFAILYIVGAVVLFQALSIEP